MVPCERNGCRGRNPMRAPTSRARSRNTGNGTGVSGNGMRQPDMPSAGLPRALRDEIHQSVRPEARSHVSG